eukprot:gb/GEZJ01004251.1/.p3 GENE.gb/GEZJ01004251.1/~~gb/GEZJ01004251.1/.p3  ORF type:complete len:127 (-),score=20.18 gb/GEZJ01004251.1/:1977-2357(-)
MQKDGDHQEMQGVCRGEEKAFPLEEISATVVTNMKDVTESKIGKPMNSAVFSVPAYFNSTQRFVTKNAGTIAGTNMSRIIHEPHAPSMSYGLDHKASEHTARVRNVLIFELVERTFVVSRCVTPHH